MEKEAYDFLVENLYRSPGDQGEPADLLLLNLHRSNENSALSSLQHEEVIELKKEMHSKVTQALLEAEEMLGTVNQKELANAIEDGLKSVQKYLGDISQAIEKTQQDPIEIKRLTEQAKHVGRSHEEFLRENPSLGEQHGFALQAPSAASATVRDAISSRSLKGDSQSGDEILVQMKDVTEKDVSDFFNFAQRAIHETQIALSEITREEIELASELSTVVAQIICKGARMMTDTLLTDDEKSYTRKKNFGVVVEEIVEEKNEKTIKPRSGGFTTRRTRGSNHASAGLVPDPGVVDRQLRRSLVYLKEMAQQNPSWTAALGVAGFPLLGLLVLPLSSLIAVALLAEKIAPEFVAVLWAAISDMIKALRLSYVVSRVSFKLSMRIALGQLDTATQLVKDKVKDKGVIGAAWDGLTTTMDLGYRGATLAAQAATRYLRAPSTESSILQ